MAIQWSRSISSSTLGSCAPVAQGGTKRLIHGLIKHSFAFLRELYCSVAIKRELWNFQTWQFLDRCLFRSIPMITNLANDWKSSIASTSGRNGIVRKSSRCDKLRSCEISKSLYLEPLFQIERSQLRWLACIHDAPSTAMLRRWQTPTTTS